MLPLFMALVFATSTIFVQETWVPMLVAALVCLLLAAHPCGGAASWILVLPGWGILQIAFRTTMYPQATLYAALHWMTLAAVFLLAWRFGSTERSRQTFLDWLVAFAALQAVLCLAQLHTSHGKVLWLIPSGYDDYVYGSFQSYNNFAQFAELAIPAALVRAFQNRKLSVWYVLTAGLLFAAVVASTSRAGAILSGLELIVVPLVVAMTGRNRRQDLKQAGLILAAIPALAVVWTFAAGWDRLAFRLQSGDLFAGRKEFLYSALDMARQNPLTGSGLGTFVYNYPSHATIDLPAVVNHAHNDWAEFAAEGGLLFAAMVLFAVLWPARGMIRHPWAIGVVVLAMHAAVDFPFARPGVVGWLFALLGMLYAAGRVEREREPSAWRWGTASVAFAGFAAAAWLGAASLYYLRDTPESLARATSMAPGEAVYWLRRAQRTPDPASLDEALRLNPFDSAILIESGLRAEIDGQNDRALQLLLDAAGRDKTWMPRWSLANFHYRRGNPDGFWKWAREAANTGSQRDFSALFRLALEMEPDREAAAARLLPSRPEVLREWISYVLRNAAGKESAGLETAARKLLASGVASPDRNYVVSAVERFLAAQRVEPAGNLWAGMVELGWLPRDIGQSFPAQPLGEGFDWRMSPAEGVVVSPRVGTMTVSFSGKQPEFWPALQRVAQVDPDTRYRLRLEYETEGLSPASSGLRWRVLDESGGRELARSAPLASPLKKEEIIEFQSAGPLVRIQLYCEREQGYLRTNGAIRLSAARLTRSSDHL